MQHLLQISVNTFSQVNCRGYNAFGRRRREIDDRNRTGAEIAESVPEGQLREEITIQSNAILTFERREERFVDPREGRLCKYSNRINLNKIKYCNIK